MTNRAQSSLTAPLPNPLPSGARGLLTRRHFLQTTACGLGGIALAWLNQENNVKGGEASQPVLHHRPRVKRVIFLHQSGAPSQVDLFDPKPELVRRHGEELPESIRMGQRLTTMTSDQEQLPLIASPYRFAPAGEAGIELSELVPHTAKVADRLCLIRSMHTEAINHDPGITFLQTGSELPGRPGMGAWVSYGLGSENENLPSFVVMLSGGEAGDQPLYDRLWTNAFLPAEHNGVKFRGGADPLLYLRNPNGIDRDTRQRMLSAAERLAAARRPTASDARLEARQRSFEMAFRMQEAAPELADLSNEPDSTFQLYGAEARRPGTYAANCLMARRMAERGVRFVQLYHRGWDHHKNLATRLPARCRETDQASAALVADLAQRGLLEDTLVVFAGEFGRTSYCQGTIDDKSYGRDHHPRCFSIWLAGGGVKAGFVHGQTDELGYNIVENPMHVHDLQATILHLLGIDHERLVYRSQGRDFRLTDIGGNVVREIIRS